MEKEGIFFGVIILVFGVFLVLGFFVFDVYIMLFVNMVEYFIGMGVLGVLLVGFVVSFSYLSLREWWGYK